MATDTKSRKSTVAEFIEQSSAAEGRLFGPRELREAIRVDSMDPQVGSRSPQRSVAVVH